MGQDSDYPDAPASPDGEMSFAEYSDRQLRDLSRHLDAARFPKNMERLRAEIARREAGIAEQRYPIRFTRSDGILGWIQAIVSRQPFYGEGSICAGANEILLEGYRRTWLGTSQQSEIALPTARVHNVYNDREWLYLDARRQFWWARTYMVRTPDAAAAAALAKALPTERSKWFDKQVTDIRDFHRLLREPGRRPWITLLIVLACVAIYGAQTVISGNWFGPDALILTNWGANVGNLTVHGGWWRLLAAIFLHGNLLHLAVNMWVLWSVGRLTERLFGNLAYGTIYFSAGLVGGLASIAWMPPVSTIGASGAIFGVLGALISYLIHGRTRVPRRVMRAHLIPTLLFTLFSILNGLGQTGIDNAAHFGGLLTGIMLGWAFAGPISRQSGPASMAQSLAPLALVAATAAALLLQVTGPASTLTPSENFMQANNWYIQGEAKTLLKWQDIGNQAAAGTIASADITRKFDSDIIPFWRDAGPRLRKDLSLAPPPSRQFAAAITQFADLRLRWAVAIATSARTGNSQDAVRLANETDKVQAKLDWFNLRSQYEHLSYSLTESRPISAISNILWLNYQPCVNSPFRDFNPVAPSDLKTDAPAQRSALACQAQHLFLTRDFKSLESILETARHRPRDLPDGSSSFDALQGGINDLFEYGHLSLNDTMTRLTDWRRAVPDSVHADLAEISALIAWAYNARGMGTADTISGQNTIIFLHRIEIARAALQFMELRARDYASWYVDSIDVNLLANGSADERRTIFDKTPVRFQDDMEVEGSMLHSFMPRWGGSFEQVAKFILEQTLKSAAMPREEKYARLYWRYFTLEDSEADIFKDAYAKPEIISLGYAIMMKSYPKSDYLMNVAGRLACLSNQRLEYLVFHSAMPKHYSASAWSPGMTVEKCNKKFGV